MEESRNFLEEIIQEQIQEGRWKEGIYTRFPPEPNGYLHLGHAKSICLNFGLAKSFGGKVNLRFDDTNPATEEIEYVNSIKKDIQWLGFRWDKECYSSDYFEILYEYAIILIKKGLAYVDDSTPEQIAEQKGTPTQAGENSPFRSRTALENSTLFREMKEGKFADGEKVLRAKIDMASPNMHLRDPILYRIKRVPHHRTGNDWCIYPMYDFAHGQSDSIEKITHSVCTLEFDVHRPLYDWFIEKLEIYPSNQYEFARLNLAYTVLSKRKLLQLVSENYVSGWDDPRMPTLSGLRRRGVLPESIVSFCQKIGVSKRENLIDRNVFDFCVREDLNKKATRLMAIIDKNPIKVILTNYEENKIEYLEAENNPENPEEGTHKIPFTKEIYIESDDFMENAPKKFFRLCPQGYVRLKHAYIIQCESFEKNELGEITTVFCRYIPESKSGQDTSGLKVQGTIHWVSIPHAETVEVRLYDPLFLVEDLSTLETDFRESINPNSLEILNKVYVEPFVKEVQKGKSYQFLRKGYFCLDEDSSPKHLIFNRTVPLKDTWAKNQTS